MTIAEPTIDVTTRLIGNDEGDVHCSVCDRRDWYQAIELIVAEKEHWRTIVCLRRYEGLSCAEQIAAISGWREAIP